MLLAAKCSAIREWQAARAAGLDLAELLCQLLPVPPAAALAPPSDPPLTHAQLRQQHVAAVSCGIFTRSHANAAVKRLGCSSPDDMAQGHALLRNMRLLFLKRISSLYEGLKA